MTVGYGSFPFLSRFSNTTVVDVCEMILLLWDDFQGVQSCLFFNNSQTSVCYHIGWLTSHLRTMVRHIWIPRPLSWEEFNFKKVSGRCSYKKYCWWKIVMKINYYILMKSILANHRKFNHILISCLLVPKITWPSVIPPLFVKHVDVGAVEKNAHL